MSIYTIGDLHLSFGVNKPMNIFGENWENHEDKIANNWTSTIKKDDLVILPGDFSWSMNLKNTLEDFKYLNKLPGTKLLIKGNHDYWWSTLGSMQKFLDEHQLKNIYFIMNNAFEFEEKIIVGTRGWSFGESDNSEKMKNRELIRLENSIKYALSNYDSKKEIICAMHYPPITKQMIEKKESSEYLQLLNNYSVKTCIYGHLHGKSHQEAVEGIIEGINLKLVSSDFLNFKPFLLRQ